MNSNKNLTNNYNPQSIQAKVIYFLKNRIITTEQFLLSSTFNSVLEYFKKNIKSESNIKLKKEYIYNNKKIDINESLINIIEIKKNSSSSIESIEIFIELEEAKNNNYNIGLAFKNSLILNSIYVISMWILGISLIGIIFHIYKRENHE